MITPTFKCKSYPAKRADRAIFFFTAFATKTWHYQTIYRRLNKMGYTVFAYELPGRELLEADLDFWDEIGRQLTEDIRDKIVSCKARGMQEFACFGVSMGSVLGIRVAKSIPDIKRIVMVTCEGNCALEVWEYTLLRKMKKLYTDRGLSVEEVFELSKIIEPTHEIEKLRGKEMLLYFSRDDKTILPHNTRYFIDRALQADLSLQTVEGRGGHIKFITKTLLHGKRWKEFLS